MTKTVYIVEESDSKSISFTNWGACQRFISSRLPFCRVLTVTRKVFYV